MKTLFGGLAFALCFFAIVALLLFGIQKMKGSHYSPEATAQATTSDEFQLPEDVRLKIEECRSLGGEARMGMCFINGQMEFVYD